ncbi:MAG TPA: hypothetical protein VFL29_13285 [Candidatus Dormibacteraeota bacterium]|nr:hypothetical protein [Candidatus Dormibacteraeota bacterium]
MWGPLPGVELFPPGSGPAVAAAFFIPLAIAVVLEGRTPFKPGVMIFAGIFIGLIAVLIVGAIKNYQAQKEKQQ